MQPMTPPILNLDGGEHDSEPEELYALADVVHVACGGHAGDEASMDRVARACQRLGTRVGAHPSYDDREGFGRRALSVSADALQASIRAQCMRLGDVTRAAGIPIVSAKPHGALYHAANQDEATATATVAGIIEALGPLPIVGPAGGALERAARAAGAGFQREAFADRGMRADGSLVPRGEPGAMVEDPALATAQATMLAARGDVDTLCIHADTAGAITIARAVRKALGPKR